MDPNELPTGLLEIDSNDVIVSANSLVAEWCESQPDDLVGMSGRDLLKDPRARATKLVPIQFLPALAEILRPDGAAFPVLVAEGAARPDGSRLVALFDARAQRAFRERLDAQNALVERTQTRLELVIDASISFAETRSESELAEVLASTTARAYAAEQSVVYLLDEDMIFRLVAGTNPFITLADADLLTVRALEMRAVLKISGVDEARAVSPAVGEAFEATGVQSMIIAPIHQGDQPLGILAAFFHHPRQFDDQASPLADALAGQASRAITALRLQRRLAHAALHDDTTGLPNRRFLEEPAAFARRSDDTCVAALFIDLDGFKAVNDQLGHHMGDELLRLVGQRLQATIRETDTAARYGGDEFVVICEVTDEVAAIQMAERILDAIRAPYNILPPALQIGASIGVSVSPVHGLGIETDRLVRAADQAMYQAKAAGGDRTVTALA